METAFDAIGFELPNENAFLDLAADVGRRGEASRLPRGRGVLHGRCLKFGAGLEVWTQFYESAPGRVVYTDCRPAFRARGARRISPWLLTESNRAGRVFVHGFIEDTETEVLFQLQNLTELGSDILERPALSVGLGGLAYRAEVFERPTGAPGWMSIDEKLLDIEQEENEWRIAGRVLAVEKLRNPQSGSDLFWIRVGADALALEIIVSPRALRGAAPEIGAFIEADVWLQGHVLPETTGRKGFEGVDRTVGAADFWQRLRRPN